ncbi:MAG TPA: hypothetical protein VMB77_00460 [Syntrophales bacterium]|nr:hypothetical protein [Syntrophales bacterium]
MARLDKKMQNAEDILRKRLLAVLPRIQKTGEMLFSNTKNMPPQHHPNWLPKESNELHDLATECVSLREQCGLNDEPSAGELFLSACRESGDMENPQRRGPRQLAAWMLMELGCKCPQ